MYLFAPKYRYAAAFSPAQDLPLNPDAALARLREDLFYHGHNHAYYRAKSQALEAEVARLRDALALSAAHLAVSAPDEALALATD